MRILPVRAGGRHRYAGSPVGFDVDDRPVPGSCRPDPEARRPTRMADHGPVPSDRQLVDAARAGSDRAWRELVHRHSAAIRAVADATGRLAPARTAHAAWKRVHREILGEVAGREGPVRAVRARALAAIVDGTYAPVAGGEPLPPPMATGAGVPTIDAVDRSAVPATRRRVRLAARRLADGALAQLGRSRTGRDRGIASRTLGGRHTGPGRRGRCGPVRSVPRRRTRGRGPTVVPGHRAPARWRTAQHAVGHTRTHRRGAPGRPDPAR